jgi:hypothetical protein
VGGERCLQEPARAAYVKGATLAALQFYVHCQFIQTIPVRVPKADRQRYRHRYLL